MKKKQVKALQLNFQKHKKRLKKKVKLQLQPKKTVKTVIKIPQENATDGRRFKSQNTIKYDTDYVYESAQSGNEEVSHISLPRQLVL